MLPLTLSTVAFFTPTMTLRESGDRISLYGSGPPVLFSSGLFGTMPRRIYSDLFKLLTRNVTMVVLDSPSPVTARTVADVTATLAVDRVGFLSHSSLDSNILASAHISSAVLCDPVVLPPLTSVMAGTSPQFAPAFDVLAVQAQLAYDADRPGIPAFISPSCPHATVVRVPDVGHADLLDDMWADLGPRVLPWMSGGRRATIPFEEWSYTGQRRTDADLREQRQLYRTRVATAAIRHMTVTGGASAGEGGLLVDV